MVASTASSLPNLWFVGVILATISSFISNLGLNLQKLLHLKNQNKPAEIRNNYHTFALWWLGLLLIVFGAIADFAALTFAPQSLIAPLGSLTLVSNIVLSPIILKEVITSRDIIATLTIVTGCIISVAFASHEDIVYSLDQLFSFFLRWPFIIYAVIVTTFIIFTYIKIRYYESIEHDPYQYTPTKETWHRLAYPAASGTIGAQSVLFAKCLVEMIVNAFQKRGLFLTRWQSYFIIIALAVCIAMQIKWLNDGLRRFDASFEVPVFQAFWVLLSVASGMIFYSEYKGMSKLQMGLFFIGITITIGGVIFLSRGRRVYRPNNSGHHEDDDEEDKDADASSSRVCAHEDRKSRQIRMSGANGYGWVQHTNSDDDFDSLSDVEDMPAVPLMKETGDRNTRVLRN